MPKTARKIPVVSVKSRHRADCKRRGKNTYTRCSCPKQLVWSKNGEEHRESAETCDYEVAEKRAREKMALFERAAAGLPEPEERITVTDAIKHFIEYKESRGYKHKSVDKLKLWFENRFQDFCDERSLRYMADVKRLHIEQWQNTWKGAKTTQQKILGRVVGFFDYAFDHGWITRNPARGIEPIAIGEGDLTPTIPLTEKQFTIVLSAIPKIDRRITSEERQRLRSLNLLMRWSGLAIRDAAALERSKLLADVDGWYKLFLRRAKTGVPVYASIPPDIAAELVTTPNSNLRYFFWDGAGANLTGKDLERVQDRLVNHWGRLFHKLSEAAQLSNEFGEPLRFHSHMLRDTFAVWCFENDMSTEDVAALLGHANIQITQRHYAPWIKSRQQRLAARFREAYNRQPQTMLVSAAAAN